MCWGKNGSGQLADDYSNLVLQPVVTLTLVTYRPTTAAVITSASPVATGRSVALTVTVIGNNPVGLVKIKGGGNRITGCGLVALSAGSGQCVTSLTTIGAKIITADCSGDINNATGNGTLSGGQVVTAPAVTLFSASLANGAFNLAYTQTITASGGVPAYICTLTLTSGSLPAGLTLSSAGLVRGTANAGGVFSFTVTATGASAVTGAEAYPLAIGANSQMLTFAPPRPNNLGTAPLTLTAIASSGLTTFTFSNSSAVSICTVSGNQLTIVGAGTCALTANQAGNANFAAASANPNVLINPVMTTLWSRKTHGNAGNVDLRIDTTRVAPDAIIEPRTIGSGHKIVGPFNFTVNAPRSVSVAPVGTATVALSDSEVIVTLTNVPDNQRVTITLVATSTERRARRRYQSGFWSVTSTIAVPSTPAISSA